jgi:hypothetical protein
MRRVQALFIHAITIEIYWVPGESAIPGNDHLASQVTLAWDASGSMVIELPYTSASCIVRLISKGCSAAKARWEADKCSKHCSYRLKGTTGTKRPVLLTFMKSLPTWFSRLKSRNGPTGVYQTQFSTREDNKFWLCDSGSVRNGSVPWLWVRVQVGTEQVPYWRSGSSTRPNCQFGSGLIDISLPVWLWCVRCVLNHGSICKSIYHAFCCCVIIVLI